MLTNVVFNNYLILYNRRLANNKQIMKIYYVLNVKKNKKKKIKNMKLQ